MTTIHDIAAEANVSTATVSRAFGKAESVREETRQRVLQAAHRLNYRPRAAARNLRRAARKAPEMRYAMGVMLFGPAVFSEDPFGVELAARLERALSERGYAMRIIPCSPHGAVPSEVLDGEVDGVICRGSGRVVRKAGELLPVVTLDHYDPSLGVYGLVPDYRSGVCDLAGRLLDAGHERIAVAAGTDAAEASEISFPRQVYEGCRDAARERALSPDAFVLVEAAGSPAAGYALGRELLCDQAKRPDAVIGSDGGMLGLYRAAHEAGLSIPEDVSFVGVDGLAQSAYLSPPLTTVSVGLTELARKAVDYLTDAATRGEAKKGMELAPVQITIGASARLTNAQ